MNYRPSFCIVNTVLNQLARQIRIPYLWQTAKTKLTFQENLPSNSSGSTWARTQRQHCTLRGEKNIFCDTMWSDSKNIFLVFSGKRLVFGTKIKFHLGKRWFWAEKTTISFWAEKPIHPSLTPKRCFFLFSLGKGWFRCRGQIFPRRKMVVGKKTNFS